MDLTSLMPGIEEIKMDSRYRLVIVAAQRARQLMEGSKPSIPSKFSKEITVALEEALDGKIEYLIGKEARTALREARLKEAIPKTKAILGDAKDADEIQRDLTQKVADSEATREKPVAEGEK